jgi:phage shock protein C
VSVNDRIYRAREDRMFLGVLGGFSLRFGIDPSIVRIAYAIVTVLTGIVPLVILYFVMAIVIPEAPPGYEAATRAAAAAGAPPPSWGTPAPLPSAWPAPGSSVPPAGWEPASGTATDAARDAGTAPTDTAGDASAGGVGFAAIPPGTAAFAAPAGTSTPGPSPAWGSGWDASGRPASGETDQHARDARTGAIVGGLVLVGLGVAFLLAQVAPQLDWGIVGPVLLIALGVVLVLASFRRT